MNHLSKDMNEYLDHLKHMKNYSDLTIASYRREIEHFMAYLGRENIEDFNDVHYSLLRGYLTILHDE